MLLKVASYYMYTSVNQSSAKVLGTFYSVYTVYSNNDLQTVTGSFDSNHSLDIKLPFTQAEICLKVDFLPPEASFTIQRISLNTADARIKFKSIPQACFTPGIVYVALYCEQANFCTYSKEKNYPS